MQPDLCLDWIGRYYLMVQAEHRTLYAEGLEAGGANQPTSPYKATPKPGRPPARDHTDGRALVQASDRASCVSRSARALSSHSWASAAALSQVGVQSGIGGSGAVGSIVAIRR